ncbi:hypothetical protein ABZ454_27340 [Streptomyces sp. NPDC005803]|uniref:hypothetical protein n=1 Tax=Streptomyces sp. NPDC005803 TaxID=3154297 RepID=UPI0034053199
MRAGEAARLVATVFSAASSLRCVPLGLVIGTLLSLIDQVTVTASGDATVATWLRVLFTYLAPFRVSSAGFFGCRRATGRATPTTRTARPSGPGASHAAH